MSTTTQTVPAQTPNLIEFFLPTTFLERGVVVPFTTPQLNGARVRPGERKQLELIIPNPSGGRGVYVVPLAGVQDYCSLTLSDRRLAEAITRVRGVTPSTIRHISREVAGEGFAGRGAIAAAEQAKQDEDFAKLQANFDLLIKLVRQTEVSGEETIPAEKARPIDLEVRGRRAVGRVAAKLGFTHDGAVAALEQLANVFQAVGIQHCSRIPQELETLTSVKLEVLKYSDTASDTMASQAQLIVAAADLTIMLATATVADARALADNMRTLLRDWFVDPSPTMFLLARPDWLLDGWNRICALWRSANSPDSAVAEIVALVPVIPREAEAWLSHRVGYQIDIPQFRRSVVRLLEDWRTGVTIADLVARNKSLLEQSL